MGLGSVANRLKRPSEVVRAHMASVGSGCLVVPNHLDRLLKPPG